MEEETLNKYSKAVLKNFDKDNMKKIVSFLDENKCSYINDLLEDYFDLFTIDYEDFKKKYYLLNEKYHDCYLELAKEDMNLFEEFFMD